jgi:glycosyltransferase involved in cell wall biosynthesis
MRILLVSQFYAPEPGAAANRLSSFVNSLLERGHEVTVICEQTREPTAGFRRPFGWRLFVTERAQNLRIHRLRPWSVSESGNAQISFAAGAGALAAALRRPDLVVVSSPPLLGALAGAAAARVRDVPLVADIRDPWPALGRLVGIFEPGLWLDAMEHGERWLYRRATRVTATTAPACRHVDEIAQRRVAIHLPNGALDELVALPYQPPPDNRPIRIGYAGRLGKAQGLDVVLDAAALLDEDEVSFVILGDGSRREHLRARIVGEGLANVVLQSRLPVGEVGAFLRSCDALLVPLSGRVGFEDYVPSKLYDAMAAGRCAIVAARGEAERLTRELGCGVVTPPEDGAALAELVRVLAGDRNLVRRLGLAGKLAAVSHARSHTADQLCELLERIASSGPQAS